MRAIAPLLALLLAVPARAGTPVPGWTDTAYVSGLSAPSAIAFLPDGRLVIAQKGGAVRLWDGSLSTLGTIPVCSSSEMGLLGVAVDPSFGSNGFLYLYRTLPGTPTACSTTGRVNEVVRVTMSGGSVGSLTVLLTGIRTDNGNHDGGGLRVGPDGKLHVSVGDTGLGDNQGCPGSSTNPYAQDLAALEGKMLRLNLDGTIPADNPFVGQPGVREEIHALGFRNPFRFGFDPVNGNLWVADVGDFAFEEFDIVTPGGNYGWPHCEGVRPTGCQNPGDVDPVFIYSHGGGCPGEALVPSLGSCVIGGAFAGPSFGPGLDGHYFFGDCISNAIFHAVPTPARDGFVGTPETIVTDAGVPSDVVFGPDGALYYVAIAGGEVRRVAPTVGGVEERLAAKKLLLRTPASPARNRLVFVSRDPAITLGAGTGSPDDPVVNGGEVRVRGAGFDVTHPLPAGSWSYLGTGYRYSDPALANGPVKTAVLKGGRLAKVIGKGAALGLVLASDPSPVDVVVQTGGKRYCATFGGTATFAPGRLLAKDAATAAACP
jgi:glucose/arabinose dehydrogenase